MFSVTATTEVTFKAIPLENPAGVVFAYAVNVVEACVNNGIINERNRFAIVMPKVYTEAVAEFANNMTLPKLFAASSRVRALDTNAAREFRAMSPAQQERFIRGSRGEIGEQIALRLFSHPEDIQSILADIGFDKFCIPVGKQTGFDMWSDANANLIPAHFAFCLDLDFDISKDEHLMAELRAFVSDIEIQNCGDETFIANFHVEVNEAQIRCYEGSQYDADTVKAYFVANTKQIIESAARKLAV